jgi:hypothetical protein
LTCFIPIRFFLIDITTIIFTKNMIIIYHIDYHHQNILEFGYSMWFMFKTKRPRIALGVADPIMLIYILSNQMLVTGRIFRDSNQ